MAIRSGEIRVLVSSLSSLSINFIDLGSNCHYTLRFSGLQRILDTRLQAIAQEKEGEPQGKITSMCVPYSLLQHTFRL